MYVKFVRLCNFKSFLFYRHPFYAQLKNTKMNRKILVYCTAVLLFNYSSEGHMLNMETWLHILVDLLMLY